VNIAKAVEALVAQSTPHFGRLGRRPDVKGVPPTQGAQMLKSVIICTAIATFAIIPQPKAQTPTDILHSWASGACQGVDNCRAYLQEQDQHQHYYDDQARRDTYQPYPSATPNYGSTYESDPYRSRSHYSSPYGGNDD